MTSSRPAPGRYQAVDGIKAAGVHYTPAALADFVAARIADAVPAGPSLGSGLGPSLGSSLGAGEDGLSLLDPAVGDGGLLHALLAALARRGVTVREAAGFETDPAAAASAWTRLSGAFPGIAIRMAGGSFLDAVPALRPGAAPGAPAGIPPAGISMRIDVAIANPPYVRTQVLGGARARALAREFGLSGRIDLYHAFVQGLARVMKPGGIAGIIVSNRFMVTRAGAALRRIILDRFDPLQVWDLGDTRLFEAAVLPAVLVLRAREHKARVAPAAFTSIYAAPDGADVPGGPARADVVAALDVRGPVRLDDGRRFVVRHGRLDTGAAPGAVWRLATPDTERWLAAVEARRWASFGDLGRIRIGVKTTADSVFIRDDWHELPDAERPELLRPLTTHHIARRFRPLEPARPLSILYPVEIRDGRRAAVNLADHPRTARYLERHRQRLAARRYVLEAGRQWFEPWVPQDPTAWAQPKLVFRDIAEQPCFWLDRAGTIVNGDCYWLATAREDMLWLALGVANSGFAAAFYDRCFNNRLYAGRRRFMTQYVTSFPLPDPDGAAGRAIIAAVRETYALTPSAAAVQAERALDRLVWRAFGLEPDDEAW